MMLARALLQTSLLLWMAQQTLQGGLRPQTVAYGRMLPNRGVGLGAGVKPGVGALGAVGNRYNTKAMKNGLGRYPGAQLGAGGYRSLGLGGRAGLKPGYGQGGYGASLGAGMMGPGLTNGLGLGLGQAGKRVYGGGLGTGLGAAGLGAGLGGGLGAGLGTGLGAGLGALPGGYGALGGLGVPGARHGPIGSPDLGIHGAHGAVKGTTNRHQSPYALNPVRSNIQHPSTLEIQTNTAIRPVGADMRGLEMTRTTNIGAPIDKPGKSLGHAGQTREDYLPIMQRGGSSQGLSQESSHGLSQGLNHGLSQGLNHGLSQGLNHGLGQGLNHGLGQGLNHGLNQGLNHGLSQGLNHGLNQGLNHGLSQGLNHGLNQGLNHGSSQGLNHGLSQGLTNGHIPTHPGLEKDIRNLPLQQNARDIPHFPNQKSGKNCNKGLNDQLGIIQQSELLRSQGLGAQFPIDKSSKYHGHSALQIQGESAPNFQQQPFPIPESAVGSVFSISQGQTLPGEAIRELGLVGKSTDKLQPPQTRISIGIESSHGAGNLHVQGVEGNRQGVVPGGVGGAGAVPGAHANLGLGMAEEQKSISKEGKHLFHEGRDVREPKALPGSSADNTQGQSYLGGQGNYMGASLGAGGYGAGLGQGGYLGGAAGKHAAGYGDGMTGYLGAMGTNGYGGDVRGVAPGYGNGYGDGYGAGVDLPAELTGVADKTDKSKALSTGAYAGQLPGAGYGALGTGLESVGKYGGAAQLPYGGAPVIPAGLEGEGGYPYTQPLGLEAEGAKSAKSYGDQAAKFPGGAAPLVNGYKG